MFKLLSSPDSNTKFRKSNKASDVYITTGLSLSPSKLSGVDFCTSASPACRRLCINFCGYGYYKSIQQGRLRKSKWFNTDFVGFCKALSQDVGKFVRYCDKRSAKAAIRLNTFSDLVWENIFPELFTDFPNVQFYDYTKHAFRCMKSYKLPENYCLTFSRSEINDRDCRRILRSGKCNVAVAFFNPPETFMGKPVVSGDNDDLRFLDPPNSVVSLTPKGRAKHDMSGFVV